GCQNQLQSPKNGPASAGDGPSIPSNSTNPVRHPPRLPGIAIPSAPRDDPRPDILIGRPGAAAFARRRTTPPHIAGAGRALGKRGITGRGSAGWEKRQPAAAGPPVHGWVVGIGSWHEAAGGSGPGGYQGGSCSLNRLPDGAAAAQSFTNAPAAIQ